MQIPYAQRSDRKPSISGSFSSVSFVTPSAEIANADSGTKTTVPIGSDIFLFDSETDIPNLNCFPITNKPNRLGHFYLTPAAVPVFNS
jgi:hypothetical protein